MPENFDKKIGEAEEEARKRRNEERVKNLFPPSLNVAHIQIFNIEGSIKLPE